MWTHTTHLQSITAADIWRQSRVLQYRSAVQIHSGGLQSSPAAADLQQAMDPQTCMAAHQHHPHLRAQRATTPWKRTLSHTLAPMCCMNPKVWLHLLPATFTACMCPYGVHPLSGCLRKLSERIWALRYFPAFLDMFTVRLQNSQVKCLLVPYKHLI